LNPTLTVHTRTDLSYDGRRNPKLEAISASGTTLSVVQREFEDSGRLECEARRMNPAAFGALPGSACTLPGSPGSFGADRITRNVYDAAGHPLRVQRAYGTALQQDYATYTYRANGRLESVTDANGNRAELRYDGHDRQSRWVFPSETTPGTVNEGDYEAYGFDAAGNRTSLRKRDGGTLIYQYDGLNRVREKTVPASVSGAAGYSVHYRYDLQNLQRYARFGSPTGPGITNSYDGFGRLESSTSTMGGTSRTLSRSCECCSGVSVAPRRNHSPRLSPRTGYRLTRHPTVPFGPKTAAPQIKISFGTLTFLPRPAARATIDGVRRTRFPIRHGGGTEGPDEPHQCVAARRRPCAGCPDAAYIRRAASPRHAADAAGVGGTHAAGHRARQRGLHAPRAHATGLQGPQALSCDGGADDEACSRRPCAP
jgi:YD repeat-containing protein